jgi:hypothetical protein
MGFVVQGRTHCAPLFCVWRACLFALTLCVPLSREAGEGERASGRTAVHPYIPLPQRGRGAGDEGESLPPTRVQFTR